MQLIIIVTFDMNFFNFTNRFPWNLDQISDNCCELPRRSRNRFKLLCRPCSPTRKSWQRHSRDKISDESRSFNHRFDGSTWQHYRRLLDGQHRQNQHDKSCGNSFTSGTYSDCDGTKCLLYIGRKNSDWNRLCDGYFTGGKIKDCVTLKTTWKWLSTF